MDDSFADPEEVTVFHTADLVLTADGMRLFRIRRTVMEMLRDRGYEVSESALRWSPGEFGAKFGTAPSRDKLNFRANELATPEEQVMVIFPEVTTPKVGLSTIKACAEAMKASSIRRAILVVPKPLNPFAEKSLRQFDKHHKVEVFQETELLVNLMESVFVPKHEILPPEEKQALMEKLMISKEEESEEKISGNSWNRWRVRDPHANLPTALERDGLRIFWKKKRSTLSRCGEIASDHLTSLPRTSCQNLGTSSSRSLGPTVVKDFFFKNSGQIPLAPVIDVSSYSAGGSFA